MLLPSKIIYITLVVASIFRIVYAVGYATDPGHEIINWGLSVAVSSGIFALIFFGSKGKWIGFGDVRLGLITGTVLGDPLLAFLMIFGASLIGSCLAIPLLLKNSKNMNMKLPFGPFLIASTAIMVIWGQAIIDWYTQLPS
jgi:leader peptidase (prepilin peptidase)/N-methyltransferase